MGNSEEYPYSTETRLTPRSRGDVVPITFQQRWELISIRDKRRSHAAMGRALRLTGTLDVDILRASLDTLFRRHEALRTRISIVDGCPRQEIEDACKCNLETLSVTGGTEGRIEAEAHRLATEFVYEPVDLTVGPLFKARLLRMSDHEHVLALAKDHIISDGVSIRILLREVETLYTGLAQGVSPSLLNIPIQYGDYAVWQKKTDNAWKRNHAKYWQERLSQATRIQLPVDTGITKFAPFSYATAKIRVGKQLSLQLRDLARRRKTTLAMIIFTVYVSLVSRFCNATDLVVPFLAMGRDLPILGNTVGFFAHCLYLRIELAKNDTFLDVLRCVNMELNAASRHADSGRMMELMPEFLVGGTFHWDPWGNPDFGNRRIAHVTDTNESHRGGLEIKPFPLNRPTFDAADFKIHADIGWTFKDGVEGIVGNGGYRADLFNGSTIKQFIKNFLSFAKRFLGDPHARISAVPVEGKAP